MSKETRTVGYKDTELFIVWSVSESVYCCRSQDTFWVLLVFFVFFVDFCVCVDALAFGFLYVQVCEN